jgi:hypothetical protein
MHTTENKPGQVEIHLSRREFEALVLLISTAIAEPLEGEDDTETLGHIAVRLGYAIHEELRSMMKRERKQRSLN